MKTIRIGGVPEHYNFPFYQLHQEQPFLSDQVTVDWQPFHTGTGGMLKALTLKELDVAVLLTEGALLHCSDRGELQIVSTYVKSPLIWGVHVSSKRALSAPFSPNTDTKFAISRPKSGSHLMAYLYAEKHNIELTDSQFVVVNDMIGAADALTDGHADVFLWEKYTAKPLVERGVFNRVDALATPWEPFVIAVGKEALTANELEIKQIIDWISMRTQELMQHRTSTVDLISEKFHLKRNDVEDWFGSLKWELHPIVDDSYFNNVLDTLVELRIIEPNNTF